MEGLEPGLVARVVTGHRRQREDSEIQQRRDREDVQKLVSKS